MLLLTATDLRASLPMPSAIEAMREAFRCIAEDRVEIPLRTAIRVPGRDAVMLVMPARCDLPLGLGGKLVSVFPRNRARGLPAIHATVVLLDPDTGAPRALVEGTALTAVRTGAVSGLATELLARKDATVLAVIGAGAQARTQVEAVCCVRRIERVLVYSRTAAHAERFAEEVRGRGPVPGDVRAVASVADAVGAADVVCTATASPDPVLRVEHVRPGLHVNAVGSFTPAMRELDPALIGRADLVAVDQRAAAMAEAGEVIAAIELGVAEEGRLVELGDLVVGRVAGRSRGEDVTVFKSVGLAIQDLAAAGRAVEVAAREGRGIEVDMTEG
jgi:ornithine cyclodeaminase